MKPEFIVPDWPAPPNVRALVTTRRGGFSTGPHAGFNLADHVGDQSLAVAANRRSLCEHLPAEPLWLKQVHGTRCRDARLLINCDDSSPPEADAAFSRHPGIVCVVLTADCLPVLLCDTAGSVVGIAHAGWRGLAAGVIESLVAAMAVPGRDLMAWLGPAIGPASFEVGPDVRDAFLANDSRASAGFIAKTGDKWLCDIYTLARQRLVAQEVHQVTSAAFCTVQDKERFFSFRRDGITGRMASLIWLA